MKQTTRLTLPVDRLVLREIAHWRNLCNWWRVAAYVGWLLTIFFAALWVVTLRMP